MAAAPTDDSASDDSVGGQLRRLRREHRDLDDEIARLHGDRVGEELAIKRMKKRKLQLKDAIARLESSLIPDEPA
ncbi:YdcH family protein [Luteimonas deserti]|uniref:YdcH family protein n=1 Tax=Luteimonas deserti TaxID=2752306 RepID=A0A7Z0QP39_9GAMM|nr:YdcH family protein [Luteimonas deserti]NYZ62083.1 YdcH family protein [Luteimonas deserti]